MSRPPAMPPLRRSSMLAVPWVGWSMSRFLRAAFDRGSAGRSPHGEISPPLLRRAVLLLLVLLGAFVGTRAMAEILPEHGATLVERGLLVLFGVLYAWISAGFWTGVMGAYVLMRGGRGPLMRGMAAQPLRPIEPASRTAIVMPICNEDVTTVFGGLEATIASLLATGEAAHFDVYILSDSGDPDIRAAEHVAWSGLVERLTADPAGASPLRIHYRWRARRTHRKAGNVADFCRRWGSAYSYFVVLDADSVMTGECLTSLVRLMQAHPDAGIIQTAPRAVGHETFHARVQQFCSSAYGPLFTAGMRFWQRGESHYWGHNAILRMAPFVRHCALAPIAGSGSLSGEILSHDFVEAALMRRAGWKVWVADEVEGSYEQVPPNLLAELQRDRRWCQGNLQNARLMTEPGIHAVHRATFLTGVLAYASSPLWLAFLLLSTLLFAQYAGSEPVYFIEPFQLFPVWPTANLRLMLTLFGLTALLLLAPKVLSIGAIVVRGRARQFGGLRRLFASALIEFVHSLLLAPVRMLFHTQFVVAAITGWRLDWKSPPRDGAPTGWREAARRHGLHMALTVVWVVAIVVGSAAFPFWLSPILLGLLAAIPLSAWGSRVAVGRWLAQRRLLMTPEETRVPAILAAAAEASRRIDVHGDAFVATVSDATRLERACAALPGRQAPVAAKAAAESRRVERAVIDGPASLTDADRLHLLSSRSALSRLHAAVVDRQAHPDWWQDPLAAEGAARLGAGQQGTRQLATQT